MAEQPSYSTTKNGKRLIYIDGVGWRYATEHRMTRWPPSLWQPGYCIGICHTEQKLHTRIGYVMENPFFGILETERHDFMKRTMMLKIKGRRYSGYGNMLLLYSMLLPMVWLLLLPVYRQVKPTSCGRYSKTEAT